ncbi:MAG TPA: NAD-dependent epimerase/dehydratase family protein [Steroidobacteraceae bacterium]|nr:NAD-dependent epimerase/dehydratase family protein [Steroidobacteraceae bacterium]
MTNLFAKDLEHILLHTRGLWEELRGKRIFVTGGTGFFGCWLLESFAHAVEALDLHATAVVLTRDPEAFQRKAPHLAAHPAVELHLGDVRSFRFPRGRFSHVVHAATASSHPEPPDVLFDTIVEGTRRTLEFAVHCGAQKFLLSSSGAVYGKQPVNVTHVPEDFLGAPDPAAVRSAYGEGKRVAEFLCAVHAQKGAIQAKIARCFAFIGAHLPIDVHFAVGNFIRDGLGGGPIRVNGDGTPLRSYLYAADLAVWLWTILCRGASCRPYNVGSDVEISIGALAATVASVIDPAMKVYIARQPDPGHAPERYVPSTQRAQRELGLVVHIGLEEAIRRTVAWHRERAGLGHEACTR